jgi:aspartyl-tRNA(Asn)/glutamyl-tRNA(Gln) amidotransferase subunit A
MTELQWKPATALLKGFARKKFSPVDVAKACLAQIERHEKSLNAMVAIRGDEALDMARASEKRWHKGKPQGPLDGVPVLIKDLLLVRGWPTLRGSRTVDPNQPWEHDAPSVARLRESGAVFLGTTTTPEFGWKIVTDSPLTGITRNPWNPELTPGGSSGGSAAGVAAGYAPLALGTDGGGSIRIPAGLTGTFGLKPSFGRVPAWPLSPFGTVAHVGPMTRTAEDSALMLNLIARPDARDWYSLPYDGRDYTDKLNKGVKGLRIAFSPGLGYVEPDPQIARLVAKAVKILQELGAEVEEVDPGFEDPSSCFRVLWWSGARALLGAMPAAKKKLLDPQLADVVEQSKSLGLDDYLQANKERGELASRTRQFMERYDLLLTPTFPFPPIAAGELVPDNSGKQTKWVNWTPFSYPFNLTQQPAASTLCGFTAEGLPAGLQIIGRMYDDFTVLRAARAYERATEWHKKRPPGC